MENMTVYPLSRSCGYYTWPLLRRQEAPLHMAIRLRKFRLRQFKKLTWVDHD